jgi:D-3-phosphoglycerate dehydrogenase
VLQPIHRVGLDYLRRRNIEPVIPATSDRETALALAATADALITRNATIDQAMMEAGSRLIAIGCHGSGYNSIEVTAASLRGIPVVNTPGANARSVGEHTVALMLAVARRLPGADKAGRARDRRFKFDHDFQELQGRTLGLAGWGHTARATAAIASAGFGMRILVWRRSGRDPDAPAEVEFTSDLAVVLAEADVLSLHLPMTPETGHVIRASSLAAMKPGAILINTGRGGLVDEPALAAALQAGHLFGAGLDVLAYEEGGDICEALLTDEHVVITPHVAGTTETALQSTALAVCEQIADILHGRRPAHLVNPEVWNGRRRLIPLDG